MRRLLLLLVLSLAVAGCSATDARPRTSPDPSPEGLRLSFIQQRFEEGTRRAGITVINQTSAPVLVRRVGLEWPGYPGPTQPRRYDVPGGLTVDLRYRLPSVDCDPAHAEVTPVAVVVTASRTVRRELDAKGKRFLSRIWKAACNERLFARSVALDYAGPWRVSQESEPTLTGAVVLTRRSPGAPVTLTQVLGSPLFDLALGAPRTLAADADRAVVPLLVTPAGRCDAHSLSAVTTPFTFRLWATFGDDPAQVPVVAVPDEQAQQHMLAFLDRTCAAR